ncbi:MAG TPA: aminopeptidase P family protein [Burkholderiaceae bacterium]
MDTRTSPARARIARLREVMHRRGVDAVLVPSSDPHLSEYLPGRWQGRQHFSGFTGSMGTLAVTADKAAVFADSRYWTQAEAELQGSGIALVKIPTGTAAHHLDWLATEVRQGGVVAVDGAVLGLAASQALRAKLAAAGVTLKTDTDVLGDAWDERAGLPTARIYEHGAPHAAQTRADKLAQVRAAMAALGASHHFVSTVDDIAWITNLRGADVDYNPVFLAHLLIAPDGATLFVGAGKIDAALQAALAADGVTLADYAAAGPALAALPEGTVLLVDPRRITLGFRQQVADGVRVVEAINPSTLAKSRKTAEELAFIREAMAQDGAAMCAFYAWFDKATSPGRPFGPVTEITIDEKLSGERRKRPGFVGLSFPVIAGWNANGAMPHYRASAESHAVIEGDGLLLIDSGGQYLGGTTDITRVWPVGNITQQHRQDYTRVLQGTLALSQARFPRGTLSPMLDALARAPLWAAKLDYGHGTGHGVGYFLNVHEGPQSISKAMTEQAQAMEPGMITSIEPGLYRPGQWGIRIENLVANVAIGANEFGDFLEFETLTLCPIDTRCIEPGMLSAADVAWLNAYHATVRERLLPLVDGEARDWLVKRTEPFAG